MEKVCCGLMRLHFKLLLEIVDVVSSGLKMERTIQIVFERQVQKLAYVMESGCVRANGMGNLLICKGTIYAETFIQGLKQHMLPSR